MEVLENEDSTFKWLTDIPHGNCFKNIQNGCIYMKTQSTDIQKGVLYDDHECEVLMYGCVELSSGMLVYTTDERVLSVHATVIIGHNSNTLKEEGAIDD